jgi:ABC-type polysaccharide/polyol phosphate transport system ATPase subunit
MSWAVDAVGISKRYQLGEREPYRSLRDAIARAARAPLRAMSRQSDPEAARIRRWIWALHDVTFRIAEGETVGIIGRNGSGKSTLLKVLSRITEPTSGRAVVRGRVGSLLEVGTGFHPELTGRENVFVNGAMLGMRRREIDATFDEIVEFAGVAAFIDTPVKHYSSGMHMRLAFAVAAHLQPNILLVDEVLAVGDAEFQRRCLSKMRDVSREGRTVVLVSHQMNQIRRLCSTGIWLNQGRVEFAGPVAEAIRRYEHAVLSSGEAPGAGSHFLAWELQSGGHVLRDADRDVVLCVRLRLPAPVSAGHLGVGLMNDQDIVAAGWAFEPVTLAAGTHDLRVRIAQLPLRPGSYQLTFALFDGGNNITGGRLVEKWMAVPPLTLDVPPLAHPQDAWAGLLNVPASLEQSPSEGGEAVLSLDTVSTSSMP